MWGTAARTSWWRGWGFGDLGKKIRLPLADYCEEFVCLLLRFNCNRNQGRVMRLLLPFLLSLTAVLSYAEEHGWRTIEVKFSNEKMNFYVTGTVNYEPGVNPSGDGWVGTGRVIGIDENGEVRFSASFLDSKKDGESISVVALKGGKEINITRWSNGESKGSERLIIPK
jgi:hypothetical protein